MSTRPATWYLLVRDLAGDVTLEDDSAAFVCMVLDKETGDIRAAHAAGTSADAIGWALRKAVKEPVRPGRPGAPASLVCPPGSVQPVRTAWLGLQPGESPPRIVEDEIPMDAEETLDAMVGSLQGRVPARVVPRPSNWEALYRQAATFARTEMWSRWPDDGRFSVEIHIGRRRTDYVAVLLGHTGGPPGLVLYPGGNRSLIEVAGEGPKVPGQIMCRLDPPAGTSRLFALKAARYGWPDDLDLLPSFCSLPSFSEVGDLTRDDARHLAVGLAAVLAVDGQGPAAPGLVGEKLSGQADLGQGELVRFVVTRAAEAGDASGPPHLMATPGRNLVGDGTPIMIGSTSWASLEDFRSRALVHRPLPAGAPLPSGSEVPLIVLTPEAGAGAEKTAVLSRLDPYGVVTSEFDAQVVVAVAGGEGSELLAAVRPGHDAVRLFENHLRASRGLHAIMVADPSPRAGEVDVIYGLFECHQPLRPRSGPTTETARRVNPKKAKRHPH